MIELEMQLNSLPSNYFTSLLARNDNVRPSIQALVAMMAMIEADEAGEAA